MDGATKAVMFGSAKDDWETPPDQVWFWSQVRIQNNGCWIWRNTKKRYGTVVFEGKPQSAHRTAFKLRHGEIPLGKIVCHTCDNMSCVRPAHLYAGTHSTNYRDAIQRGRMIPFGGKPNRIAPRTTCSGESNGNRKLSWQQVVEIRKLRKDGWTLKRLGSAYSVDHKTIYFVVEEITWKKRQGKSCSVPPKKIGVPRPKFSTL